MTSSPRNVALQLVERLGEDVPRLLLIALGPEPMHQLRATEPPRARDGELRHYCECAPASRRCLDRHSVALQRQSSERSKPQHVVCDSARSNGRIERASKTELGRVALVWPNTEHGARGWNWPTAGAAHLERRFTMFAFICSPLHCGRPRCATLALPAAQRPTPRPTPRRASSLRTPCSLDPTGARVGTAEFREDRTGTVHIDVTVVSTTPGLHGLHFHSVGACSGAAFADAGGHFNPVAAHHGLSNAAAPTPAICRTSTSCPTVSALSGRDVSRHAAAPARRRCSMLTAARS